MKKLFVSMLTVAALVMAGCDKNDDNGGNGGNGNNGGNEPVGPNPTELHESLKGSNYLPIVLDSESFAAIESKIVADIRPNDSTVDGVHYNGYVNCWHWVPAFAAIDPVGPNFYGVLEGWMTYSIDRNAAGWYGMGIEVSTNPAIVGVGDGGAKLDAATIADMTKKASDAIQALSKLDASYSLHLALKSSRQGVYTFKLYDGIIDGCEVNIGATAGDGSDFQFARDGEWHEVIIPLQFFINKGLNFANIATQSGINVLALTQPADGTGFAWATDLNLDAVFFYQPAK